MTDEHGCEIERYEIHTVGTGETTTRLWIRKRSPYCAEHNPEAYWEEKR